MLKKLINAGLIIAFCVIAAAFYGVVHDQFTVRICPEYFTVFHPNLFGPQSETMLGILWGVAATWWVGAILGWWLAIAASCGAMPMVPVVRVIAPVLRLLAVMAVVALCSGVCGFALAEMHVIQLDPAFASHLSATKYSRLLADSFAHNASYLVGIGGGCIVVFRTWKARKIAARLMITEATIT